MNPTCEIKLDIFKGPLDLLLHLINKNKLDITNLPISLITAQYLEYLEIMKALNIVVAGEYLFIAATLCHIKSKILLPLPKEKEEDNDPRIEIIKPLKEFIVIKKIASSLEKQPILRRDIFIRGQKLNNNNQLTPTIKPITINMLIKTLKTIIRKNRPLPPPPIKKNRVSVNEQIKFLLHKLIINKSLNLFKITPLKKEIAIANFLAVLELTKNQKIKVIQETPFDLILLKKL